MDQFTFTKGIYLDRCIRSHMYLHQSQGITATTTATTTVTTTTTTTTMAFVVRKRGCVTFVSAWETILEHDLRGQSNVANRGIHYRYHVSDPRGKKKKKIILATKFHWCTYTHGTCTKPTACERGEAGAPTCFVILFNYAAKLKRKRSSRIPWV